MGHIARLLEEASIPTVVIGTRAFRDRLAAMRLPRTVITPHLLGRPLGAPGDVKTQRSVILSALDLLENAVSAGTIVDPPTTQNK